MTDQPTPQQVTEIAARFEELQGGLTAGETFDFEMEIGADLGSLQRTVSGQVMFIVWAHRLHSPDPITVGELRKLPLDQISAQALEVIAPDLGKATGVDGPSPTPIESSASSSLPSATRTTSPSTSSSD